MDPLTADEYARRASSFGRQADAYDRYRPDYPAALLEWGLAPVRDTAGLRVLDLAAGTGKLTEGLHTLGVDVVAVEPDAAMLARLTERLPDVEAHVGTAESIPLPDASVEAIFVGQALHWFDLERAFAEMGRVLRPGGHLVAVWNYYDDRTPWVARMGAIGGSVVWSQREGGPEEWLRPFGDVRSSVFPHRMVRTVDSMVATVATQSGVLVSSAEDRERTLGRVREFLLAEPATSEGEFTVPILCEALLVTPW